MVICDPLLMCYLGGSRDVHRLGIETNIYISPSLQCCGRIRSIAWQCLCETIMNGEKSPMRSRSTVSHISICDPYLVLLKLFDSCCCQCAIQQTWQSLFGTIMSASSAEWSCKRAERQSTKVSHFNTGRQMHSEWVGQRHKQCKNAGSKSSSWLQSARSYKFRH